MELLSINVMSKELNGARLLVYGTCVEGEEPEIFEDLSKDHILLHVCLEREHMNKVGFKMATIFMTSKPKEVIVVTIDGSPHCLQLHFAIEQAKNIAKSDIDVRHYVIEHGKLFEVSPKAVKIARHLSWIQKSLQRTEGVTNI